ncbi:hypothetical protein AVEN_272992-1 [Araneus ventricosus]|uniref:Uncharacterized protein n=1 Tax=Araneus ventricosus TaxID=182803 RepID=A0A4Y2EW52_ARAVE|nr:hypothetical protein AVEN_272992-1 [Araneus ventricosus]
MIQHWQDHWNRGDTGRKIEHIIPKVSIHPENWSREEIIFSSEHGPFPAYRKRLGLRTSDLCGRGKVGTVLLYATECIFTASWHMTKPSDDHHKAWLKTYPQTTNPGSESAILSNSFTITLSSLNLSRQQVPSAIKSVIHFQPQPIIINPNSPTCKPAFQ